VVARLLKRSPVMLPISGTLEVAHLKENDGAVKIQLSDDEFAILTRELGEIAWNLGPSGLIFSDRQ
jgi:pyridoxine 4-dehydrogenase